LPPMTWSWENENEPLGNIHQEVSLAKLDHEL